VNWHQGAGAPPCTEAIRPGKTGTTPPSVLNRTHAKQKFLSQRGIGRNCKTNSPRAATAFFYILAPARIIIAS
jgi:hypothetical protein